MAEGKQTRRVLLEVRYSTHIMGSAMAFDGSSEPGMKPGLLQNLSGARIDPEFPAVELPALTDLDPGGTTDPYNLSPGRAIREDHAASTFLVRAECDAEQLHALEQDARNHPEIVEMYSDPEIQVCDDVGESRPGSAGSVAAAPAQICPGSPALGTDRHVASRIGVPYLHRRRMDGRGVFVAVVDTGINTGFLRRRGKRPILDAARSWMARRGDRPGQIPVGHGTMVAYDVLIAAPRATLLDIALLRSTRRGGSVMAGLLSDAIRAYAHLYRVIRGPHRPGAFSSLVVNNSWGAFREAWDFPAGHPGRYIDNPRHPFNRLVGVLEHAGADILFAAGNCGRECPDGRCAGEVRAGILGANAHPQVLTVGGVDILERRVGYSTSGPGRLMYNKPDLCGYTHFRGSGVYAADGGTSAATPVVAGLIAAFRSRFQRQAGDYRTSPAAIRNLLMRTAKDRGALGFDFDYGWGIADGRRLALVRSLSVESSTEAVATSIEEAEASDAALLDPLEGFADLEPMGDDFEAAVGALDRLEPTRILEDQQAEIGQYPSPAIEAEEREMHGEHPVPA